MVQLNRIILADESATTAFGKKLALACAKVVNQKNIAIIVYLCGDLGAGKTTLSQGFLKGLNFTDAVKSPTYSLVEYYMLEDFVVYHFDLYRLADPEELEFMGFRDYLHSACICLIEWPERAAGFLPTADLTIYLDYLAEKRQISVSANTEEGQRILSIIQLNNKAGLLA